VAVEDTILLRLITPLQICARNGNNKDGKYFGAVGKIIHLTLKNRRARYYR
jgi:hypothetical protein